MVLKATERFLTNKGKVIQLCNYFYQFLYIDMHCMYEYRHIYQQTDHDQATITPGK